MAGPTDTQSTSFDKTVQVLIRKQLEDELLPTLPHLMAGNFVAASFVKGTNGTMRFLRVPYLSLLSDAAIAGATAGTAPWLTEGVAPTADEMVFDYEEFTAHQAGTRISLTDVAMLESPLDLMAQAAKLAARQAAEVVDSYVGQVLAAGTNVLYAAGTARTAVAATSVLTGTLVRRAVQSLKADSVPAFGQGGGFRAIIHPAVVFDFEEDNDIGGWLDAARYSGGAPIINGELGKYAGVRFFESPRARVFASAGAASADVYSTIILGPDAYAFGDFGSMSSHYVAPGGHGDELAQLASVGWKAFFGAMLVDAAGARYIRIETGSGL
jgi:N4-gp56 family major capsid protein